MKTTRAALLGTTTIMRAIESQLASGKALGLPAPGTTDALRLMPLLPKATLDPFAPDHQQERAQVRKAVKQSRKQRRAEAQGKKRGMKALTAWPKLPGNHGLEAGDVIGPLRPVFAHSEQYPDVAGIGKAIDQMVYDQLTSDLGAPGGDQSALALMYRGELTTIGGAFIHVRPPGPRLDMALISEPHRRAKLSTLNVSPKEPS